MVRLCYPGPPKRFGMTGGTPKNVLYQSNTESSGGNYLDVYRVYVIGIDFEHVGCSPHNNCRLTHLVGPHLDGHPIPIQVKRPSPKIGRCVDITGVMWNQKPANSKET